jgi:pimeloyl-ACP methyl ester carboxylesterase
VRVLVAGPPDGPPVLLVAGWACSAYVFRKNIVVLASAGHRVFAPDLKGHGLSDKPLEPLGYTRDAMAAHVLDIMDALSLRDASLVGHSMGGSIVAAAALRSPDRVRRLGLLSAAGLGTVQLSRIAKPLTPAVLTPALPFVAWRWTFKMVLRLTYGDHPRFTERDVDEYWAPTQFPEFVLAMREAVHAFRWNAVTEDELRRLVTPTLVMFGRYDRFVDPDRAEELARALPNGRCELLPDVGHVLPEEAPERVNGAILEFLRGAAAA